MITDYVEIKNGVRTNLDVRISELTEKDYTVGDSIEVLNSRFASEKTAKIETANNDIKHYEAQIAKQQAKGGLVAETLLKKYKPELEKAQNRLKEAQNWTANYASCYDSRNPNDVIAKIVDCKLSLMNPRLRTRQEGKASFLQRWQQTFESIEISVFLHIYLSRMLNQISLYLAPPPQMPHR